MDFEKSFHKLDWLLYESCWNNFFVCRIAEENAACQERVSRAIHGEVISELVSIECAGIVEEVTRWTDSFCYSAFQYFLTRA